MLKQLDDYDWKEAFGVAGEGGGCLSANLQGARPGETYNLEAFSRHCVAEIAALDPGENDGRNWIIYGRLHDGRWFYIDAGCDYTGWDCISWGQCTIARDREECERWALTADARARFGLPELTVPTPA